jgi:hypothetical protein
MISGKSANTILRLYDNSIHNLNTHYNNTRMETRKKKQIDTNSLKILFLSDLDKLMYVVGSLVQFSKEVNQWKQDDYLALTMELDKFYSVHSTRTNDLIHTLERLDNAKLEYAKLKALHEEVAAMNEQQATIINELLQRGA